MISNVTKLTALVLQPICTMVAGVGALVLWVMAVVVLLVMIVLFAILGTKPLLAILNYCWFKRKIEADIWDKTCQTDIISQGPDRYVARY